LDLYRSDSKNRPKSENLAGIRNREPLEAIILIMETYMI
jgi:hypothetical protein